MLKRGKGCTFALMTKDSSLVSRLQDENTRRDAFKELVKVHAPTMYAQIRRMVMNHDDADDVLQNALIKVWTNLDSFRGDSQLSTWLFRIAHNETITFLTRGRTMMSIDTPAGNATDEDGEKLTVASRLMADSYFDGDETEAQLQEAIATLPPKQRTVFTMKYYDDLKYEEMSGILDTSVGALKASYHHAVKKITAFFESKE